MLNRLTQLVAAELLAAMLFFSGAAFAQTAETVQTLDRVDVNSLTRVLEMEFSDPARENDFIDTGVSGLDFRACKLTAIDGLFCLDGKTVKVWPTSFDDPDIASDDAKTIVDCTDPVLDLDARKDDTCTALTVDLRGTIWLAGKNKKGPTFVLNRITEKSAGADCAEAELTPPETGGTVYCSELIDSDKPLLIDLNPVDGDVAEAFPLGAGVLYLEERKTAVFQPADGSTETPIASGRKGWGLAGNEQLQSIALWQSPDGTDNRVLVTTDRGRVLAVSVDANEQVGAPEEVFNVVNNRAPVAIQCDFVNDPAYTVRTSSKSGLVYVTDRQFCEVLALEPDTSVNPEYWLTNAQELVPGSPPDTRDITLSTADSTTSYPPQGATVAPGIGINLRDCDPGPCPLIIGDNGDAAAALENVTLLNPDGPSGLTLFQIKNIPDCRYIPDVCVELGVNPADVIVDPGNTGNPAAQQLNITPLLPTEITDLFESIGGLPDMYMSRWTRGQRANGFTFEAFFGRTEEGVVFRDTFDGTFDVFALVGSELGCTPTHPPETSVEDILMWDTVTTVSERYPGPKGYVDRLVNVGCGSSRTLDERWSLKPYNTEITPCTWSDDPLWTSDGTCAVDQPDVVDDAVFAKLLLSLYAELGEVIDELACVDADIDPPAAAPLSPDACATAQSQFANGLDKLEKCWVATQQPKQSSGDQNCQAFVSQLSALTATLSGAMSFGPDPANRVGELQARIATIWHVYEDRFVPSIPADGFDEPQP